MPAILMTWTEKGWPRSEMEKLVKEFDNRGSAMETWRIIAHKQASIGDTVWLLKQGKGPKGIFGWGEIAGKPRKAETKIKGQNDTQIPVLFKQLVDPYREFLIDERSVRSVLKHSQMQTPGSGITLTEDQSDKLFALLRDKNSSWLRADTADDNSFEPGSITDMRQKIEKSIVLRRGQDSFRRKLIDAFRSKCCVTGCAVPDVLEAAHVVPYRGNKTNVLQNGLLLRADLHTLFDVGLIWIDPASRKIEISDRLKSSSYAKLAGVKLRKTRDGKEYPTREALEERYKLDLGVKALSSAK